MLEERQLGRPTLLLETLTSLLADPARLQSMAECARAQARPGAAAKIANRLIELARR
jgi:UDP-N-acetylglucosamine:LPS N-acetylglucosamine transferase